MANRAPAFQFYPDKALAGTIHLGDKAFKAYWRLIWFMWLHSEQYCDIVNDRKAIMAGTGLSSRQYQKVWVEELMNPAHPMFRVEGNRIICNGLRKEALKQADIRKKRQKAALAKQMHMQMHCTRGGTLTPSPSPSTLKDTPLPPKGGGAGEEAIEDLPIPPSNSSAAISTANALAFDFVRQKKPSGGGRKAVADKVLVCFDLGYTEDEVVAAMESAPMHVKLWEVFDPLVDARREKPKAKAPKSKTPKPSPDKKAYTAALEAVYRDGVKHLESLENPGDIRPVHVDLRHMRLVKQDGTDIPVQGFATRWKATRANPAPRASPGEDAREAAAQLKKLRDQAKALA